MNWNKWVGATHSYRRREILHETGHSHGLADACVGTHYTGMMNNGGSCGWDETITGWNSHDRSDVNTIYP